jgi:hypothetical protein
MSPRLAKFFFTSHVTFSVGWLGAVVVFLVLAITGLTNTHLQTVRSVYLAMELSAWYVIVPFCLASLITGLVQALGTKWGLFRHYWIIVKLILTVAGTILLLLHIKPIGMMAGLAAAPEFSIHDETGLRIQLIADAGGALLLLLITTTISVYKPWSMVRSGKEGNVIAGKVNFKRYLLIASVLLLIFIIIKHLLGGGMHHH